MPEIPTGWFVIRSELNGMVADVKDGYTNPGDPIITWPKQSGDNDNQVWRYNNGFFINKRSGLGSFGAGAITAQVKQDSPRNLQQQWGYDNGYVFSHADTNLVLDVDKGATESGANVIIYGQKDGGSANQKWKLEPV
ncbi:hypothetical protein EC973_001273 [Apophysomyces ossiformis]|uniref:Ricin B lectin domain-containing protein n=1 Tax=Apophysomyces ossiformis TaxID=679940 RepID=A0A8H7ES00_9FUNG|nr:hypothetical protein EC973_001273 [Apophysomyces ossiformis]